MSEYPKRIQLSRKKGWRMPENTVKVDRSTGFGNPFPISTGTSTSCGVTTRVWFVGTWGGPGFWCKDSADEARALAVKAYRAWIEHPAQAAIRERALTVLRGKNLACRCRLDQPCHADVLLDLANRPICDEPSEAA
jgi:hypothetical protein